MNGGADYDAYLHDGQQQYSYAPYGAHEAGPPGGSCGYAPPNDSRYDLPPETYGGAEAHGGESRDHRPQHGAYDGGGEDDERAWAAFKEMVVSKVARPALKQPYEHGHISKDAFKQILKKVAEKVVGGYKKEGLLPPSDLSATQRTKIEKLVNDYVALMKGK